MKPTLKKAFEFSIEKWEIIVRNNGLVPLIRYYPPHIEILQAQCGLCELYHERKTGGEHCKNCPLNIKGLGYCMSSNHPYLTWREREDKASAQAVLDLIKEKYEAHLKRYYGKV